MTCWQAVSKSLLFLAHSVPYISLHLPSTFMKININNTFDWPTCISSISAAESDFVWCQVHAAVCVIIHWRRSSSVASFQLFAVACTSKPSTSYRWKLHISSGKRHSILPLPNMFDSLFSNIGTSVVKWHSVFHHHHQFISTFETWFSQLLLVIFLHFRNELLRIRRRGFLQTGHPTASNHWRILKTPTSISGLISSFLHTPKDSWQNSHSSTYTVSPTPYQQTLKTRK